MWHSVLQRSVGSAPPPTYTGPGDVVSGASAWFGLRAYSAAVAATGTQKAVKIRRSSDDTEQDILITTAGDLDTAAVVAFSTVDGTQAASISGTTLTITTPGAFAPISGDTITGSGVAAGTVIVDVIVVSVSYVVNVSQTVASTSMVFTRANYVTTWYDQSGNGRDVIQTAIPTKQPQLLLTTANGSKPALGFSWDSHSFASANPAYMTGAGAALSQPYTFSSVVQCTTAAAGGTFDLAYLSAFPDAYAYFNPSYDTNPGTGAYAGTGLTVGTTPSTWYAIQVGFSGASGYLNVSGSATSANFNSLSTSTSLTVGAFDSSDARNFFGLISETGIWPSLFASNGSAMNTNQRAYWGI